MGFVEKAIDKKKQQLKDAAKAKAKKTGLKLTPGLCPKTGGRHTYGRTKIVTTDDKGKNHTHFVVTCKCGKTP